MCCRSCGAKFRLEQFADSMDDALEDEVANVRSDRF
ncbi:MAG: dual CXXC motif small (seleno)protein [Desulfobacteria bacterium]